METLATLTRRSQIALDDLKAQHAICRDLSKRVNAEPSLAPILNSANERLAVIQQRYNNASAAAWSRTKVEKFGW
jgi:hypothetical protein